MAFASIKRQWRLGLEILIDIVLINLGFVLAHWIRYDLQWPLPVAVENYVPLITYAPMAAVLTVLLTISFVLQRVYVHQRGRTWLDEAFALLNGTTTGILFVIVITYFVPDLSYSRSLLALAAVTILSLLVLSRIVENVTLNQLRKRGRGVKNVLIVGAGELGRTVMRSIAAHPEFGYCVIGFVDDDPAKGQTDLGRMKALGSIDALSEVISGLDIDIVIITLPWMYQRKTLRIVRQCERHNVQAYIVPDLLQITISQMGIEHLGEVPMIGVRDETIGQGWRVVKRVLDIVGSLVALIVGAPLALLVAIMIKLDSPGSVIYAQTRLGESETPFTFFKFRTMRDDADEEQDELIGLGNSDRRLFKMKDDPRRTRVGRILRKFSIDEFPQFFNVLRGDMSIVGPRPPLPSEVEFYLEWHRRRLDVPVGITGMWQVSGRSDLSMDEAALLDIWYAENWTLLLDLKIMLKTIPVVLFGRGAY
jgi:exopolysaccharide biosynthesis polyprenyl glycosylphosphotransferase